VVETPTLTRGDTGEFVVDLHAQLTLAGYPVETIHPDRFGGPTEAAVVAFQRRRGLDSTGIVDADTWISLAEAVHHFGDRLMCRKTPMMRGDDVAELQLMLGSLGFDAGWIDGIFGPDTEDAVADFQRNAGLPVDGVAGPTTCAALTRLQLSANAARPVAAVREQEQLRNGPPGLVGRRIVVGDLGMSPTIAGDIGAALRKEGARVLLLNHPDGSTHARGANQFDAEVYVGVSLVDDEACTGWFYANESFSSYGGRHLAELGVGSLRPVLGIEGRVEGKRLPVLRETRMPAVLFRIGPPDRLADGAAVTAALLDAIGAWVIHPHDS
jgi:N-acetylmuramoyl-L-alanine amidase